MRKLAENWLDVGDGHSIYWAAHGVSGAPAVLLVHGGGGHTFEMEKMTGLENRPLQFIEMHRRGVGNSMPSAETAHNTIDANIADIEKLRAALEIEKWSILSWSFGATFMTGYAFAHPERCESLIAYAPFLGSQEDYDVMSVKRPDIARIFFGSYGTSDGASINEKFNAAASSPDIRTRFADYYKAQAVWRKDLPDMETLYHGKPPEEWQRTLNIRAIDGQMYDELYHGKSRFLEKCAAGRGRLTVPATLIYGGDDAWSGDNSYARGLFAAPAIRTVEGAGHDVHQPAVQAEIARCLDAPKAPAAMLQP